MTIYQGSALNISSYLKSDDYFFIPEYQRRYSWSPLHVKELVTDISEGLEKFKIEEENLRNESYSKYLGCVIDWYRNVKKTDFRPEHNVTPYINNVRELIDGQQRTSTISILCTRLYWKLEELLQSLDIKEKEEERKVAEEVLKYQNNILLLCFSRKDAATQSHRPFIIREGEDKWSRSDNLTYQSPLSKYLCDFVSFVTSRPNSMFLDLTHDILIEDENLYNGIKSCDEQLNEIADNLSLTKIIGEKFHGHEVFENLYQGFNTLDLELYIKENSDREVVIRRIIGICSYVKYMLNYCYITIISSPSQDKSLEIFQSINATGLQLSAFDLVKPLISKAYSTDYLSFSESSAFNTFNEIDEWLSKGDKNSRSHSRIKSFFEIAKFSFNVNAQAANLCGQRKILTQGLEKFLNDKKNNQSASKRAETFCLYLKSLKLFLENLSLNKEIKNYEQVNDNNGSLYLDKNRHHQFEPEVALNFLYILDTKHEICHAFLVSIYHQYLISEAEASQEYKKLLFKAINFCAVYYSYFRCIAGKYPDNYWQELYCRDNIYNKEINDEYINTVASSLNLALVRASKLTKENSEIFDYFNGNFEIEDIADTIGFELIKKIESNLRYSSANSLIKYFTLISSHCTLPETDSISERCGLDRLSDKGDETLTPLNWLSEDLKTVEHIAPQKLLIDNICPWDETLSESSDTINSIGNLTLISKPLNSSIKEDAHKKAEAFSRHLDDKFQKEESYITDYCKNIANRGSRLHYLKSISNRLCNWLFFKGDINSSYSWNKEFINKRTINMAYIYLINSQKMIK